MSPGPSEPRLGLRVVPTGDPDGWDEFAPWERQALAGLLDGLAEFVRRYVAFALPHELTAVVLWVAHAHTVEHFNSSPRMALLSPEPGSGKTRVLEVLELLVPGPLHALSASAPSIFRLMASERVSLLLDECDAIFNTRGKDDSNEDLRALLNAGHRKGATIPRCVGPSHSVTRFPVYGAVALAGLGDLPPTLMSRSVVIRMRRRAPGEPVVPFRYRLAEGPGHALRDRLDAWAGAAGERLEGAEPTMPPGVTDRPADVWEPLLAVADDAGGDWPDRARAACVALANASVGREASLGVRLLTDLRTVFRDADRMDTASILGRLCALDESPWAELRGRPLDARGLAWRLSAFQVESKKVWVDGKSLRGYRRVDLWDPWERYCAPRPSPVPAEAEEAEGPEEARSEHAESLPDAEFLPEGGAEAEGNAPPLTCELPLIPDLPPLRTPETAPATAAPAAVHRCTGCARPLAVSNGSSAPLCSTCLTRGAAR